MLALFLGMASIFVESGFTSALIQKRDVTEVDLSSVFYFNVGSATVMALLLCVTAPSVARFYDMPILESITYVMAFNVFLSGFSAVQRALLTIELNFRTGAQAGIIASIISSFLAVVLAWHGFGVWSLVWQSVAGTLIGNLLIWLWHPWRTGWRFEWQALRGLYRFGGYMLYSNLLDVFYTRLNTLLIGKLYSAQDLGFYTRADRTQQLPGNIMGTLVGRVAFPLFAAAKHDHDLLRGGLQKSVRILMMVNLPLMLGLYATADTLVLALFGPRWTETIPYLRILSLAGIFWPLHVVNLSALKALGHSKLFFRLEVAKKIVGFSALLTASFYGVMAMAWSVVLVGAASFIINAHYSGKFLAYSAWAQVRDSAPYALLALLAAGVAYGLGSVTEAGAWLTLSTQSVLAAGLYAIIGWLFKLQEFRESVELIRSIIKRKMQVLA